MKIGQAELLEPLIVEGRRRHAEDEAQRAQTSCSIK